MSGMAYLRTRAAHLWVPHPPPPTPPSPSLLRRAIVAPIVRIGFHLLPVVRGQGAGAALLLEREAQPGWRGAVADFARAFAGMRHLGATVGGVALLMPPAVTLVTQSVLLLLVSNLQLYCHRPVSRSRSIRPAPDARSAAAPVDSAARASVSAALGQLCTHTRTLCALTARRMRNRLAPVKPLFPRPQLLEHPLMQHRLGLIARGLEWAAMPLLVLQPLVVADSPSAAALLAGKQEGVVAIWPLSGAGLPRSTPTAIPSCSTPCRRGVAGSRLPNHGVVHAGGSGGGAAHLRVHLQLGRGGTAAAAGAGRQPQHRSGPPAERRQPRCCSRQPCAACCAVQP